MTWFIFICQLDALFQDKNFHFIEKENFSFLLPNCQHLYSGLLGTFLSKTYLFLEIDCKTTNKILEWVKSFAMFW